MTVLSSLMFGYLLIVRPFKFVIDLVQQAILEGILLLVLICLLGIAIIDANKYQKGTSWIAFNNIIIYCNTGVLFVTPVTMVIKFIIAFLSKALLY